MTRSEGAGPDREWDLPAPEAAALLMGPRVDQPLAVALALKELIARRVLRFIVEEHDFLPRWLRVPEVVILGLGDDRPAAASRSLRCVIDRYSAVSRAGTRQVSVEKVALAVFERYAPRLGPFMMSTWGGGYVEAEVLPALEARGLYAREWYVRFGLFERCRWVLTPASAAALAELEPGEFATSWGLASQVRALEDDPGSLAAAFAAIDASVDRAWSNFIRDD
jgi:hypothetical protein